MEAGLGDENHEIEQNESENSETEDENDDILEDPNLRRLPRLAKTEAYRRKLWFRDNESEEEVSERDDDEIDQDTLKMVVKRFYTRRFFPPGKSYYCFRNVSKEH